MSRSRVAARPPEFSEEFARYVQYEYNGDGGDLRARIAQLAQARSAPKGTGLGRAVLRVLAKLPEVLASATTPGGT